MMEYLSPEQERLLEKHVQMDSVENPEDILSELNSEEDGSQSMDTEKRDLLSQFVAWVKAKAGALQISPTSFTLLSR